MVIVVWENGVSYYGASTALNIFGVSLYLIILCLPNVSNESYNGTGADQLSASHEELLVSVDCENVVLGHA